MRSNRGSWIKQAVFGAFFLISGSPGLAASAPAKAGPVVQVVTYYSGMPAASIEKSITNRIERWVNQAPGARWTISRSFAGVSIVRVFFGPEIDPKAALETTGKLALGTLPTLPPNTLPPVVLPGFIRTLRPVGFLAVHGAAAGEVELRHAARVQLRDALSRIKGAVAPVAVGGRDRTVLLHLDDKKLLAHNLSATDVVEALRKSKAPCAYFGDLQILLDETTLSLKEFKALPVLRKADKTVRLGDLGTITEEYSSQTVKFRFKGRNAVGVPIYAQAGTNPRELTEKVSKSLPDLRKRLADKINLEWVPFGMESEKDHAGDGLLTLSVRAPSISPLSETEKRVAALERFLQKNIPAKEREAILAELGAEQDWSAIYTANAGPMDATLFVQLSRERTLSAAEYAAKLRRLLRKEPSFADLGIRFASRDMPAPVDIRIKGDGLGHNLEEMMRLAEQVRRKLAAIEGAADVDIAQRLDAPYLVIKVEAAKAAAVGLSSQEVLTQCVAALKPHATPDRNYWMDSKGAAPSLTIPFSIDMNLENVLQSEAQGTNQNQAVKLSSLATIKRTTSAVEIDHDDLQRVLDVRANIGGRKRSEVIADIRKVIQELSVPEGMKVELVGEK